MITLFVIGLVIFAIKVALFGMKAAWGITKALLFVLGLPALLIALLMENLNIINTVYSNIHTRVGEIGMQRAIGMSAAKTMGLMPCMQGENTVAASSGNRAESISAVLPQMQAREHHQCKKLYY